MSGRPRKQGLDYFSMDCHMDDKIKLIEAEFGLKGFAIIVKLFQKIYGEFGYYCEWNNDTALLFARENLSSCDAANLINEVVSALIRRNIFSEELYHNYNILTSQGVQKRYMEAVSRRDEVMLIKEYLLISADKNTKNVVINSINVNINSDNVDSNQQSKGKESKGKESKGKESRVKENKEVVETACYFPNDENLNQTFLDFVDMRKKIKAPMTDHAIDLAIKRVIKMSSGSGTMDNDIAIEILEQSILGSWKGLFELKKSNNGNTNKSDYIDKWRDV